MTDVTDQLIEVCEGPHEWGYRDPVTGDFIKDNAPFDAAMRLRELRAELLRVNRICTDHAYTIVAMQNMLGPKGLEVVRQWRDKGVSRVHYSWGPEAKALSGEDRAQEILNIEAQMANATPLQNLDGL